MTKSEIRRQKIIDVAVSLFVKDGLHNTSMQRLANQADVATGSLYTYFESKKALVMAAFCHVVEQNIQATIANYDPNLSVKTRFYQLLNQKIRFEIAHPENFRFLRMCAYEPMIMAVLQTNHFDKTPLAEVLMEGKQENILKNLPIQDFFYYTFGGVTSLLEWRLFNQKNLSDTDIDHIIKMTWDAIKQ